MFRNLKQRMFHKSDALPTEFTTRQEKIFSWRATMVKIEKGMKTYRQGASSMAEASKHMTDTVGGDDPELVILGGAVTQELGATGTMGACQEATDSIALKIKLIDTLKKKSAHLQTALTDRDRAKRKHDEYEKKGDQPNTVKWAQTATETENLFNELYAELDATFKYMESVADAAKQSDAIGFLEPELQVFKHSQKQFYHNCMDATKAMDTEHHDLKAKWSQFEDELRAACDGAGAALSTVSSQDAVSEAATSGGDDVSPSTTAGDLEDEYASRPWARPAEQQQARPPPPPPTKKLERAPSSVDLVRARALYDYVPQADDELQLREGDIVVVAEQMDDGWWNGSIDGQIGIFPSNYVELLQNVKQSTRALV